MITSVIVYKQNSFYVDKSWFYWTCNETLWYMYVQQKISIFAVVFKQQSMKFFVEIMKIIEPILF